MIKALLIMLSTLGGTPPASMSPVFTRADIALVTEALALDDTQRTAVTQLIMDYDLELAAMRNADAAARVSVHGDALRSADAAWRTASNAVGDAREALRQAVARQQAGGVGASAATVAQLSAELKAAEREVKLRVEALARARERARESVATATATDVDLARTLTDRLDEDIAVTLDDEQRQRWPAVRARLLRGRALRELTMPGANIDLQAWVTRDQPGASGDEGVSDLLETWAIDIDDLLERLRVQQGRIDSTVELTSRARLQHEHARLQQIVSQATLDTAAALAEADQSLTALHAKVRRRSLPHTWAVSDVQKLAGLVNRAEQADVATAIDAAVASYDAAHAEVADDWAARERSLQLLTVSSGLSRDRLGTGTIIDSTRAIKLDRWVLNRNAMGVLLDAGVAMADLEKLLRGVSGYRLYPNGQLIEHDSFHPGRR